MKRRGKLPTGIFYPKNTQVLYIRFTNEFGKQTVESSKGNDIDVAKALLDRRKRETLGRKSPVVASILGELTGKAKTFRKFLDEDYYKSVENEASYKIRKYTLEKFADQYGHLLVRDINLSHLLEYKNNQRILNKKLSTKENPVYEQPSNKTRNRHRSWITGCLSYASSMGLFSKTIYKDIMNDDNYQKLPEVDRPKRAYSIEQLHKILDIAENRNKELYQIIRFGIVSGIRKGHIFSFQWKQIDWNTNEITIPPKNPNSSEWLKQPISEPVRVVLKEREEVRKTGVPYVFYNPETSKKWSSLDRSWWHVLEEAGIRIRTDKQSIASRERKNNKLVKKGLEPLPKQEQSVYGFDAVFHGLRHSFGSHLNDLKIPIATCSLLLGHSSIETTEKYLKSLRGVQDYKEGLDRLSSLVQHKPLPPHPLCDEIIEYEGYIREAPEDFDDTDRPEEEMDWR